MLLQTLITIATFTLQPAMSEDEDDDTAFCCDSVEIVDERPRGYGCTEVIAGTEEEEIEILNSDACRNSIGCDGSDYTNDNGTVTCY